MNEPNTPSGGELCKRNRVLCKDQREHGSFWSECCPILALGRQLCSSLGLSVAPPPHRAVPGGMWYLCAEEERHDTIPVFPQTEEGARSTPARGTIQTRGTCQKKWEKCHIWASEMKEAATTSATTGPRPSRSRGSAGFTRGCRAGSQRH